MYNKLFTKILDSSIWLESTSTRIVWLTLIAGMDETGFARFAAVRNLAHRARVTLKDAQAAVTCLESPDEESSDPEHDGRRIERVPGGWMILNANKHRELVTKAVIQEQTRLRVQRHRDKKKAQTSNSNGVVTPSNAPLLNVTPSEAVSEAVSRSEKQIQEQPHAIFRGPQHVNGTTDPALSERAGRFCERYADLYPKHRKGARYLAKPALDFPKAVELCQTWDDARLDRLAAIFLKTDHEFAESGSRTIGQFAALASWCDARLCEVEAGGQ